jgi:hypothetical protein
MTLKQFKSRILDLLSANEFDAVFDLFNQEISHDSSRYKGIVNLRARYTDLKQSIITGGTAIEKIQEGKNQLRTSVMDFTDLLEDADFAGWTPGQGMAFGAPPPDFRQVEIPVFFSRGTPFNDVQKKYVDYFKSRFEQYGLRLETAEWSAENALLPVRQKLKEVYGCVVLAIERMHSVESIYKQGTPKETKAKSEFFTTPWIQMEAAMAYQQELPLLIFAEQKIKNEGMIELGTHEFRIFTIHPETPDELEEDNFKFLIKSWAEKVRKFYVEKNSSPAHP